jgi:hypothetical protein
VPIVIWFWPGFLEPLSWPLALGLASLIQGDQMENGGERVIPRTALAGQGSGVVAQVSHGGLTSVERSLVEHAGRGEWLDLAAGDEAVDEAAMRSWGESRSCRASVIRDILRGRLAADIDPHGVRLRGARVTGRLDLENLTTDVFLELENCLLEEGVVARDARLPGLWLSGCQLEHPAEAPLDGAALSCGFLGLTGARIIGHTDGGAVELLAARISGRLDCTGVKLCNDSGPALDANTLQVGQNMLLSGEFTGRGSDGAVCLLGAHIDGILDFGGAQLRNEFGPALVAEGLHVGLHMFLRWFNATVGGEDAAVNLKGAQVGGMFQFAPAQLEHKDDSHRRLAADGLSYSGVPGRISAEGWRELLREGTPGYAAQPYQQLAAGYRALGDDREARRTLMAQRDDQLARADTSWWERLWGKITKITLGYGYQPWRALWFLAAVVALSCVLAVVLGWHGALAQTSQTATPGRPCTVIQKVSVGLDLNLPVGSSVARPDCDLSTDSASVTAAWLSAVGWVLRLLAWVFAALFIAGFTSAVRKT